MSSLEQIVDNEIGTTALEMKPEECTRLCFFCGKMFPTTSRLYSHHKICKRNNPTGSEDLKVGDSAVPLLCIHCGKAFAFKSGLCRHERFCKQNDFPCYQCTICFSNFSRIDYLKNHMRNCSSVDKHNLKNTRGSRCVYENCSAVFFHKTKLVLHLKQVHGSEIQEEQHYNFKSMGEFLHWKYMEEEKTHSYFTQNSGIKGATVYYHCQQDGSSKPHCKMGELPRKTTRRVKKGLIKQDKLCLARITAKLAADGSCKVIYQPTHSHKLNIKSYHKSPLLLDTVKFINHQLSIGVAPKDCFKNLNDSFFHQNLNNTVTSIQESKPVFISPADSLLHFKRMNIKSFKDDSISVMIRVLLLSKEEPNPIILYKPLGAGKVIGPNKIDAFPNSKDLFMLGIQTKQQRNVMLGSKNIIAVSIVEDTNEYGYPLLTLVVPDKHNRGYPVGFFISSSMDQDSVTCFFAALKSNCSGFDSNIIEYLILPPSLALYEAIIEGWQMHVPHIWCLWNIHKDFQHTLFSLIEENLVQGVYNYIFEMIYCVDQTELKELIVKFIYEYSMGAPDFIKYFRDKYEPHVEQWAIAYRESFHGHCIDTTVLNAALHNNIKFRHNQRLDDLINILLDIEEDYFRRLSIEKVLGVPFGIGDIQIQHDNSLHISDNAVVQVHDALWEISVDTDSAEKCEVVRCADTCSSKKCYFVCKSVGCNNLCSHLLACTCKDKNPLCKHIHKVRQFIFRQQDPISTTNKVSSNYKNIEKINSYIEQLSVIIDEPKVSPQLLQHIETSLEDLIGECRNLSRCGKNDINTNCFEFEYENICNRDNETPCDIKDNLFIDVEDSRAMSSFTPLLDFSEIEESILRCGLNEVSFLNLKLLDPFLSSEDISLLKTSEKYQSDWMYPSVINAFCYQLQLNIGNSVMVVNSDLAFILARNEVISEFQRKAFTENNIIILPMCLTYTYWTCVVVYIQKSETIYFNSKGTMPEADKFVIHNLQSLISETVSWKVSFANYDFQNDYTGCGVQVCHFVEQVLMEKDLTPLIDVHAYRKHIYKTVVGGCLKRTCYDDTVCGSCNEHACASADDNIADLSICCDKCNQWFHIHCIGLQTMDITNMSFTCPL